MWLTVISISCLFFLIGTLLTKENSKYLLAGYNKMSHEEQDSFDLTGFLRQFKTFFFALGSGLLSGYALIKYIWGLEIATLYFVILPTLAFAYFFQNSRRYYPSESSGLSLLALVLSFLLVISATIVLVLFTLSIKENPIVITEESIKIEGMYGIEINYGDISNIEIANRIPAIASRVEGFSLGRYMKGTFTASDGTEIRLFVDMDSENFIRVKTNTGLVFFSYSKPDISNIVAEVEKNTAAIK